MLLCLRMDLAHNAPISRADAAGRVAVTGPEDKTGRFWSLAADEEPRLERTFRLPVGPRDVGKIYAVVITPYGATITAGG